MNLLITSGTVVALLHVALLALALMPTLIYGHEHRGNGRKHAMALAQLANGAHLVMETHDGAVLMRAARGAVAEEPVTPVDAMAAANAGNNKRVKNNNNNNKKTNKSTTDHGQGRRTGYKKLSTAANAGEEVTQQQQQQAGHRSHTKQQRQMLKQQQQEQGQAQHHHHGNKRSGQKSKQSENAEKAANGEKSPSTCRYAKSTWSECDAKTNMRTRTLTLKKGESNCVPTRTMQKKCKKACHYEKGAWSACTAGQMTREDKLKPTDGANTNNNNKEQLCEPVRKTSKKCNPVGAGGKQGGRKERKHKEKGTRRVSPQAQ